MRYYFIAAISFSFIMFLGFTNNAQPDNVGEVFPVTQDSGKFIRKEKIISYYNDNGKISNNKVYNSYDELITFTINKYNITGNLTESTCYYSRGKLKSKNKISYDVADSIKIYEEFVDYAQSGGIYNSSSFFYNMSGILQRKIICHIDNPLTFQIKCDTFEIKNKISANSYITEVRSNIKDSLNGSMSVTIIKHDIDHRTDTTYTYINNTLTEKSTTEFSENGRIIKTATFNPLDITISYTLYEINKGGDIFTSTTYNEKHVITEKTVSINDSYGNPLKVLNYNGNDVVVYKEEYKTTYDKNNHIVEVILSKYYPAI